ncbi:MAG: RHS repeat-associated core domain-containing protein, partial [Flavihumibacter sp.]
MDMMQRVTWLKRRCPCAVKHFVYDDHLLVQLTNQSGFHFYWEYEGAGDEARCIHTWGDGGVLEYWLQYEEGKTIARNSLGHTTEYYYDERKLIYKIIDANGGITRQVYDAFEELVTAVSPEGDVEQYRYNEFGRLSRFVNANDESERYQYDEQLRLVSVTSAGGRQVRWRYNAQGRLVERRSADNQVLRYMYEGQRLESISDGRGRRIRFEYDRQHNLVGIQYPNGTTQYWQYDALGNLVSASDTRGNTTRYGYDDGGNMLWLKEADGNEHVFSYDPAGNLVKAEDATHRVVFEYGALGTLLGREQNGRRVRFAYDTELQLKSIANEGGEVYRFGLDALGQVVNEWGFDGLHRRYLRDGNGRVTKIMRPGQKWTAYEYDSIGNIVQEAHSDDSMAAYKYDADGLLVEAFNEHCSIGLHRDKAGRVTEERQDDYTVSRRYNSDGQCTHISSSLGADIQMNYDSSGYLERLQAGGWAAGFVRDSSGLELQRQLTGEVTVFTERDRLGRVTRRSIGAHNIEQSRHRYDWGAGNKLHRVVNELSSARVNFEYDVFDNLVSGTYSDPGHTETIYRVPDKIGNLFKTKDRSDRKYSKGGRLEEDEKYCYHYDAEGNLVFKEFKRNENGRATDKTETLKANGITPKTTATGWEYEWAGNGMLQKVINPGGREIAFFYDPLGRRTAKIIKEKVNRYIWDGNLLLHEWGYEGYFPPVKRIDREGIKEENEPADNVITWVYDEDSLVPCAKIVEGETYSVVSDYIGKPTHCYNSNGEAVWETEYGIYGELRKVKGSRTFIPFRQPGQFEDEELGGLYYNRFRYYDAGSGNYISQDPIGLLGGMILYGYVHDTNAWVDIFGLSGGMNGATSTVEAGIHSSGLPSKTPIHSEIRNLQELGPKLRGQDVVIKDVTGRFAGGVSKTV